MKYKYFIRFQLVNRQIKCNLKDFELQINMVVKNFNTINSKNPKKIVNCIVYEEFMDIELHSLIELQVPSKALAGFSKKLLEICPEMQKYIIGKRLFQSIEIKNIATEIVKDFDDIKDVDAVKLIIDLFFNNSAINSDSIRMRNKLKDEIKMILIKFINENIK